ncbi:hypothetical protein Pmani_001424 [Petrolisthes manimaculis]|uniref:FAD-binding FR-type domain-containing protein n=1 Tax=Petrolisthes manimaculis TaxID=1843537 RepID=A0AAE1QJJ2_9EUCA|nr:hypothetical protein Pmani_001424 [Petrolisthes manimaculis]
MKKWGAGQFWGLGTEYDPEFLLTSEQKALRDRLVEVCRTKIRPLAIENDRNYQFPHESIKALAELGLLGLIIPKKFGGLGENHVCCSAIVEALARYGCAATAMIFCMHMSATSVLLYRYHSNPHIQALLKRITAEGLLGGVSASDPATGSHDWFPLSSKVRYQDDNTMRLLKYGSWCTGAGFADFYCIMTISPQFTNNFSALSFFLVYKDEIRASTDDWSALGMHANQSGPMVVEGVFNTDRLVGSPQDGRKIMEECVDAYFLLLTSCVWSGIALGCIDLSRRHVTQAVHADVGMRVCDYPVIQDYVGESVIDTNTTRCMNYLLAQTLDVTTDNNNWDIHSDVTLTPRTLNIHWLWQLKFSAAKNVSNVTDRMLQACGGAGYKTELGLERLYRDGKAGWVMAPSNEILRNLVGVSALNGFTSIDLWEEMSNERLLQREVKKMTLEEKEKLGKKLLEEAQQEREVSEGTTSKQQHPYQDTDFLNPFNTAPPAALSQEIKTTDGVIHKAAFKPDQWTSLSLLSRHNLTDKMATFTFALPNPTDHTGCYPGQYVTVKVMINGKEQIRYFSPVSTPDDHGKIELVLRYETQGLISNYFRELQPGGQVEFQGPCGGLEYTEGSLDEVTVVAGGGGVTPGVQLLRHLTRNPQDTTKMTLIYYAETPGDLLYRDELDGYAKTDDRVRVVYTVGEGGEGWEGDEGFINTQLLDKYITKPNAIKHKVVICGGPTMSISTLYSLHQLGFPPQTVFIYGQFGVEQVKAVYGRQAALASHTCH